LSAVAFFAVTPLAILLAVVAATWAVGARRRGRFLREAGLVLLAYFAYFLVRGVTEGNFAEAREHAQLLVEFEKSLGIFVDPSTQALLLSQTALIKVANWIYVWGHWPVVGVVIIWLFTTRPEAYLVYRNALLISGGIGLILYVIFPAAPPRLIGMGFADTVFDQSTFAGIMQPNALTNQYAAFPSLHFGWSLLMGIAIMRETHSAKLRLLAPFLPIAMLLSVVITANHYVVDAVAGGVVALISLQAALIIHRLNPIRIEWVAMDNAVASVPRLSESAVAGLGVSPHHARQAHLELEARLAEHATRVVLPPT
jgi:PAP2 superfamily protein